MPFEHILNSDAADAKFEHFWYLFKSSVVSFSRKYPEDDALKALALRTEEVSDKLNQLKTSSKYDEIVDAIEAFLEDFFWTTLQEADDRYYISICYSNIKRWFKIDRGTGPVTRDISVELYLLRVIYDALDKDIRNEITHEMVDFHSRFPNGLRNHMRSIADTLTAIAIKYKYSPILNKICEHSTLKGQLFDYVKSVHGVELPKCMCKGPKIIAALDL